MENERHPHELLAHKLLNAVRGLDPRVWFEKAADSERATRITPDPLAYIRGRASLRSSETLDSERHKRLKPHLGNNKGDALCKNQTKPVL